MKLIKLSLIAAVAAFSVASVISADTGATVPKEYPLTTCPVSGEKLGDHGKPVKVTDQGTDVYLCCKSCVKDFKKEPAKYTKMVKDASTPAKK